MSDNWGQFLHISLKLATSPKPNLEARPKALQDCCHTSRRTNRLYVRGMPPVSPLPIFGDGGPTQAPLGTRSFVSAKPVLPRTAAPL